MLHDKLKPGFIILSLLMAGCTNKDELTRPVKVSFKIGIVSDNTSVTSPKYLDFNECQIGIQGIRFEGKREAGGDVYFETDSKMNLNTITFFEPVIISEFDVPQGIYYYMKWDIDMRCIEEYDPCAGIIIKGNYYSLAGPKIPFVLEIEQPEEFSIRAFDPQDKTTIVLTKDKSYEAKVLFNPVSAFQAISQASFESAHISYDTGNMIIIISRNDNMDLYTILLDRIFQSAKVVIK